MTVAELAALLADIPEDVYLDALDDNDERVAWLAIAEDLLPKIKTLMEPKP